MQSRESCFRPEPSYSHAPVPSLVRAAWLGAAFQDLKEPRVLPALVPSWLSIPLGFLFLPNSVVPQIPHQTRGGAALAVPHLREEV